MLQLTIQQFKNLYEIPKIEKFSDILPVFATQEYAHYLKETGKYSTIWFHGTVSSETQFILPFAVKNRYIFRIGIFLTATISLDENSNHENEGEFLNSVLAIIKKEKLCDWIGQSPNWALFRLVPSNAIYCEFGTYRIDLKEKENIQILKKMHRDHRQHIIHASKNTDIVVKNGAETIDDCIKVFSLSFAGKSVELPTKDDINKFLDYLPDNIQIYVSYYKTVPQSSIIFFSDKNCYYAVYAGMVANPVEGINHLLHWQAMMDAKSNGIRYYDLVGSRINPIQGSKQYGLKRFKSHFGGEFLQGYLWKLPISKTKYYICYCLTKLISLIQFKYYRGDIIDHELKNNKK